MSFVRTIRRSIRKLVFGDTLLPHGVTLGFTDPQSEIAVWLESPTLNGTPIDVTFRHSMACANPFTICVAFDQDQKPREKELSHLSLKFRERNRHQRVLGELRLKPAGSIATTRSELHLFEVRSSTNHCVPGLRLWAHDLLRAYRNWRRTDSSALKMSLSGMRAMSVMFIRPHPVGLASHGGHAGGNIFPINLMGNLGDGWFAFALVDSREAAINVESARRIAVTSVPFAQAAFAFQLAPNHFRPFIDWNQLPFSTRPSSTFDIPVPSFAQRVRELEVAHARTLGSHRFFVARIVSDERLSRCEELHLIDGIYHAWRLKGRTSDLDTSLATDSLNKRGVYTA